MKKGLQLLLGSLLISEALVYPVPTIIQVQAQEVLEQDDETEGLNTTYLDLNGEIQEVQAQQVVLQDDGTASFTESGWYLLSGSQEGESIEFSGEITVNLILEDNCDWILSQGLQINNGASLIIWGQEDQTGTLHAYGAQTGLSGAAIGPSESNSCKDIIINGGIIYAASYNESVAAIGTAETSTATSNVESIIIQGGKVYATAKKNAAAIGSFQKAYGISYKASVNNISITGGHVEATVESGVAIGGIVETISISGGEITANCTSTLNTGLGIGITEEGSEISISGSQTVVTAQGSDGGAGIGAYGTLSEALSINITEATVTATSGDFGGAGIGTSYRLSGDVKINIEDAIVNTTGGSYGAGIGTGYYSSGEVDIFIKDSQVQATAGRNASAIGSVFSTPLSSIQISGGNIKAIGGSDGAGIGDAYSSLEIEPCTILIEENAVIQAESDYMAISPTPEFSNYNYLVLNQQQPVDFLNLSPRPSYEDYKNLEILPYESLEFNPELLTVPASFYESSLPKSFEFSAEITLVGMDGASYQYTLTSQQLNAVFSILSPTNSSLELVNGVLTIPQNYSQGSIQIQAMWTGLEPTIFTIRRITVPVPSPSEPSVEPETGGDNNGYTSTGPGFTEVGSQEIDGIVFTWNEDGTKTAQSEDELKVTIPSEAISQGTIVLDTKAIPGNITDKKTAYKISFNFEDPEETIIYVPVITDTLSNGTVAMVDGKPVALSLAQIESGYLIFPASGSQTFEIINNARIFPDLSDKAWYVKEGVIDFVSSRGILNGQADGSFDPDGIVSRAMFSRILWNLFENPESNAILPNDVPTGQYFSESASWAKAVGLMGQQADFDPYAPLSRQDMALILYRLANEPQVNTSILNTYSDKDSVAAYARKAVAWAVEQKIIGQGSDLKPESNGSRAEISAMITRFIQDNYPLLIQKRTEYNR